MTNINGTKFSNDQLINNVCEKSYRNSERNHNKLKNCGLKSGKKYPLGNNIYISFWARHGGISKKFYWGDRLI